MRIEIEAIELETIIGILPPERLKKPKTYSRFSY